MKASRFNLRVYGICIEAGRLLVNDELIGQQRVIKLPGGGLELGEGTIEGLKREWREELGLEIEVGAHFYTTDFFQASAFDASQVVSIYYFVRLKGKPAIHNLQANERSFWMPLTELSEATFTLPIDKVVGKMLAGQIAAGAVVHS